MGIRTRFFQKIFPWLVFWWWRWLVLSNMKKLVATNSPVEDSHLYLFIYFLFIHFAKNINCRQRRPYDETGDKKWGIHMGWDCHRYKDLKGAVLVCTHAYVLMWPNPDDTHWSKLTRCWASGHKSTFPSQIPLCLAPNGRFLPKMGKSYGDGNKFSTLHLVTVIPLCRENEVAYVLPLTPVGPEWPDGGWSIRIMSMRSYRKIHAGKVRNF